MSGAATQIAAREFDDDFFRLPQPVQAQVQSKIDSMSLRLATFPALPHDRLRKLSVAVR